MEINRSLAIFLVFFAGILVIIFLVVPQYKKFQALRLELGEKKAEFNAKYEYYTEVAKIYYTLKAQPEAIQKVDNALPSKPDLSSLLYFFQKTANDTGLILRDVFLSRFTKSEASGIIDIGFSIDVIGDYNSLKNFIMSLERSAKLFEITNISFGSESASRGGVSTSSLPKGKEEKEGEEKIQGKLLQMQRIYNFNLQVVTHAF